MDIAEPNNSWRHSCMYLYLYINLFIVPKNLYNVPNVYNEPN